MNERYHALDVFRGIAVAAMILVNSPGSWEHVYAPLRHASWHGLTPTDLVFPFFLFIVGSAYYFSTSAMQALPLSHRARKIIKRSLYLFAIGLGLNLWAQAGDISQLRLFGVLQRIALCSLLAAFILMLAAPLRLACLLLLLAGYTAVYMGYHDAYSLEHNPVRQLDTWLIGENHMWAGLGLAFDPEGLLSTLPATVNVLIGYESTRYLLKQPPETRNRQLCLIGIATLAIGILLSRAIPVNKSLWTASFVVISSGLALLFLALLGSLTTYKQQPYIKPWLQAAQDFGLNPLFIYVLSWLWIATYYLVSIDGVTLQHLLFQTLANVFPAKFASLVFALSHLVVFWLIARYLRIKRIRIAL